MTYVYAHDVIQTCELTYVNSHGNEFVYVKWHMSIYICQITQWKMYTNSHKWLSMKYFIQKEKTYRFAFTNSFRTYQRTAITVWAAARDHWWMGFVTVVAASAVGGAEWLPLAVEEAAATERAVASIADGADPFAGFLTSMNPSWKDGHQQLQSKWQRQNQAYRHKPQMRWQWQ
jgi:hypothetical protein